MKDSRSDSEDCSDLDTELENESDDSGAVVVEESVAEITNQQSGNLTSTKSF